MPRVQTSIHIAAPPVVVWSVLADTAQWHTWNPTQPWLKGPLQQGGRARIAVGLGRWMAGVPITLVTVEPDRALFWQGGVSALFAARHGFSLAAENGGTRVDHIEHFSGLLPTVLWWPLRAILMPGYQQTNAGLRARAESLASQPG